MEHAKALYPLLIVPQTDPDGVGELRAEIKMLEAITGTEKLIEDKRQQINDLYANQTDTPAWLLIGADVLAVADVLAAGRPEAAP